MKYLNEEGLDFRWTMQGGLKMLSIQVDSSRFDRIDINRFPCCRFVMPEVDLCETWLRANRIETYKSASYASSEVCCEEGSCVIISRILTSARADRRHANRVES